MAKRPATVRIKAEIEEAGQAAGRRQKAPNSRGKAIFREQVGKRAKSTPLDKMSVDRQGHLHIYFQKELIHMQLRPQQTQATTTHGTR
jgi:hypothetical protein